MLRNKLTELLGCENYRQVIKQKIGFYRIINMLCAAVDDVIDEKLQEIRKQQKTLSDKITRLDTRSDPE